MTGNCLIYLVGTWYLHSQSQRFFAVSQVVGVALMCLNALVAITQIILSSQSLGNPPVPLRDNGEREWDMGQLVTVMLLGLPLITALEIYRGKDLPLRVMVSYWQRPC